MAQVALGVYSLRIKEFRGDPDAVYLLGDVQGSDLLDGLQEHLESRRTPIVDDERLAGILRIERNGRTLRGILRSGDYGTESEIINVTTGALSHTRAVDEADTMPFFFLIEIPAAADEGVMLLQRLGQFGIRQAVVPAMERWFEGSFPNLRLSIKPIALGDALARFFEAGAVKAMHFISYDVPSDVTDAYDSGPHEESEGYMALSFRANRGKSLSVMDRVRDVVQGRRPVTKIIELSNYTYDDVKVEIQLGRTRRVINLGEPLGPARVDVTDRVAIGADGHPTYVTIAAVAAEVLVDVRHDMGNQ